MILVYENQYPSKMRAKNQVEKKNTYGRKSSKNFTAGISGPYVEAVAFT